MSETDELLSRADALLNRWRSAAPSVSPPQDYPVLTDTIEGRESDLAPIPGVPRPEAADAREAGSTAAHDAAPEQVAANEPLLPLPGNIWEQEPDTTLPPLPVLELAIEEFPGDADLAALEARLIAALREALVQCMDESLGDALNARVEGFVRRCAEQIVADARDDILARVQEAVQGALAQEIAALRAARTNR